MENKPRIHKFTWNYINQFDVLQHGVVVSLLIVIERQRDIECQTECQNLFTVFCGFEVCIPENWLFQFIWQIIFCYGANRNLIIFCTHLQFGLT